ncbi:MFS transporter [Frigidibacter sp. SD6-1]|uniref:MFS transporter n=1 Tax=Frigidibacter sp. SD6-1 TaxID=3032581 RepID=UPI0024E03F74|nr:MFS transporter [Frigidibacter sp. SD6-1]
MFSSRYFQAYGFWHAGEGFQTILMMWYMAFHARLTAAEIGFYQSLQLLPFLILTALGGSMTDRLGARLSYSASTGLFALTLGLYGLTEAAVGFSPWAFGAYCLFSGIFSAISNPAIDTFIPEATPRPATENALLAATAHNLAKLSGNLATLFLPVLSALGGFVVNGLLMALSVLRLRAHAEAPTIVARPLWQPPSPRRVAAHFRAFPESFDIFLGSVMLGAFVIPAYYIFQPMIMREHFPDRAALFGVTGAVGWVGAILASGVAVRLAPRIGHPGRWALLVWALAAALFSATVLVGSFWAFLVILFLLGGNSVGKALIYGQYLSDAPAADRAFLIGVDQTAIWGLATLGTAALGWLVEAVGLSAAVLLNSGAVLLFVVYLLLRGRLWTLGRR